MGVGGLAAGAALVYLLDPDRGGRRRAIIIQKARHAVRETSDAVEVAARDLGNRSKGLVAEGRARLSPDHPDDQTLAARVRSRLGRLSSHPHAIEVHCEDGRVELTGPVLADEARCVLRGVARVRGVTELYDSLERHDSGAGIPSLQDGPQGRRRMREFELLQEHWAPSARVLVGAAGASLLGAGLSRRGPDGLVTGIVGGLLLMRSLTNLPFRRILGFGAGRRAIDLHKIIHIAAPVSEVYSFFRQFETFPRFMSHVHEVVPHGSGAWRWRVDGPGGVPVSWTAELTRDIENEMLAWKTMPGSVVSSAGIVRFEPEGDGTRINIRLSYNPPGGALGHAFARVFGADPKHQMDDDLLRLKSLLEEGKATGRKETVRRDDLYRH